MTAGHFGLGRQLCAESPFAKYGPRPRAERRTRSFGSVRRPRHSLRRSPAPWSFANCAAFPLLGRQQRHGADISVAATLPSLASDTTLKSGSLPWGCRVYAEECHHLFPEPFRRRFRCDRHRFRPRAHWFRPVCARVQVGIFDVDLGNRFRVQPRLLRFFPRASDRAGPAHAAGARGTRSVRPARRHGRHGNYRPCTQPGRSGYRRVPDSVERRLRMDTIQRRG